MTELQSRSWQRTSLESTAALLLRVACHGLYLLNWDCHQHFFHCCLWSWLLLLLLLERILHCSWFVTYITSSWSKNVRQVNLGHIAYALHQGTWESKFTIILDFWEHSALLWGELCPIERLRKLGIPKAKERSSELGSPNTDKLLCLTCGNVPQMLAFINLYLPVFIWEKG